MTDQDLELEEERRRTKPTVIYPCATVRLLRLESTDHSS